MAYIGSSPTKVVSRQSANIFTYTATANQTAFTGSDANGNTLACTPSDIMVHMNGLRLEESDFTATTTTVTLGSGAAAGDEVTITAFVTFETADAYTKSAADTRYVNVTGDSMTGNLGVKATLKTTHADADVVQFGGTGYLANWEDAETYLAENLYVNSSGGYRYLTNSHASLYSQTTGKHQFKVAPSGSADGTPTLTTGLEIDNSGRVTMPNQPSFGAYQLTGNYTTGSGYHKMILDGVRWNEGSHYSTTNSKFTAPIDGVYHFSAHVNRYSVNDDYYFSILFQVNNAIHTMGSRFHSRGATDLVASMSQTIKLTANDYVEVYSYSNDTSSGFSNGAIWNTFSGFLVG